MAALFFSGESFCTAPRFVLTLASKMTSSEGCTHRADIAIDLSPVILVSSRTSHGTAASE